MSTNYIEEIVELMGEDEELIIDAADVTSVFDRIDEDNSLLPAGLTVEQFTLALHTFITVLYGEDGDTE